MTLYEAFDAHFGGQPDDRVYCPYRVCPVGAHIDHQQGPVTGFALDHGVTLVYRRCEQPLIDVFSMNFPGNVRIDMRKEQVLARDWGDYARAAACSLRAHGHSIMRGFSGVIEGTLPIGGLSSSAAVVLTYLTALCRINAIQPSPAEMIAMALWAERNFIGLNIGKLDPSCEVYCKKDHLLYLDTRDDSIEQILSDRNLPDYKIGVFFSGVSRALIGSAYNARVDECKSAAYALKAYAGIPYGRFNETVLRDVPEEVFLKYKNRLPESFARRAEHFYGECARVQRGVAAWRKGDIHAFGQVMFESGNSSIEKYESGSPELRALHEIMLNAPGIYGGRFSGAGFKGCCMALVNPARVEQIEEYISRQYLDAFPEMRGRFSIHFCETADGVRIGKGGEA